MPMSRFENFVWNMGSFVCSSKQSKSFKVDFIASKIIPYSLEAFSLWHPAVLFWFLGLKEYDKYTRCLKKKTSSKFYIFKRELLPLRF